MRGSEARGQSEATRPGSSALGLGLAWLAAAALALTPASAHAQPASTVRAQIENTQSAIDRASATLRCPPGDVGLACTYYAQALSLQTSARASYSSGFLRDALALTFRARDRVSSALGVGQDPTGVEFVRFSLERTDALLDRVAPSVRDANLDRAQRLLASAFDLERRARMAVDAGRVRLALIATFQSRERALGALRVADGAVLATPEGARAMLERTDDLLRAEAWLADAGASAGPYGRAIELEGKARGRLDAGDAKRAIELSLGSRDALARAFGKADHPLGRALVERRLSDNASDLETMRAFADDPAERDQLARAEEHHHQAQQQFRAGRLALALEELHASREALSHITR
jgi:hypothetical protein